MSWTQTSERGSVFGMRVVLACLRTVGVRTTGILIEPVILYFFLTGRRAREASRSYLERVYSTDAGRRALGHAPGPWTRWRHFRAFGQSILDRACFWSGLGDRYKVSFEARAEHERLQASGRGAIFLGAHLGSFDVLRALATQKNKPVHLVMFQAGARKLNTVFRALAPEMEMRAIHVDQSSIQSILDVKACIERGEFVAILGDRAELASPRRVGSSAFLGTDAKFPLGPFLIAQILDCPVYLIFALRGERRSYEIHFERFAERIALDRGTRDRDLQVYLDRYVQRLEAHCLRAPLQWFNFYDFWSEHNGVEPRPASFERHAAHSLYAREASRG